MPKKAMRRLGIALVLVVALAFMLGACSRQGDTALLDMVSLYDNEVLEYSSSKLGVGLTVPADWRVLTETDNGVIFTAPDNSLTLTLVFELGGYTYYSIEGLQEMAAQVAQQILQQPEILQTCELIIPSTGQMVTAAGPLQIEGQEEAGANAVCEVVIVSPLSAVRYYLVTVAEVEAYEANARLLREVYASFYLQASEDELYQGLLLDSEEETAEQTEDEGEPNPEPDAVDEPNPEPNAVDEPNPEPDAVDEPNSEPDTVDEPNPEPDAVDEPNSEPDTVDEPNSQSNVVDQNN